MEQVGVVHVCVAAAAYKGLCGCILWAGHEQFVYGDMRPSIVTWRATGQSGFVCEDVWGVIQEASSVLTEYWEIVVFSLKDRYEGFLTNDVNFKKKYMLSF